jgi:hypothetical protein
MQPTDGGMSTGNRKGVEEQSLPPFFGAPMYRGLTTGTKTATHFLERDSIGSVFILKEVGPVVIQHEGRP